MNLCSCLTLYIYRTNFLKLQQFPTGVKFWQRIVGGQLAVAVAWQFVEYAPEHRPWTKQVF